MYIQMQTAHPVQYDSAVVSFNLYNMKQYFFIQTYTYSVRHTVHNVKEIQNWHIISAILLQGKCKIPWQEIVNGAYKCFVTIFDAILMQHFEE